MPNLPIEMILSRQWADNLSVPVFLVDTKGNLLFFNEPAEALLGLRFEETGSRPLKNGQPSLFRKIAKVNYSPLQHYHW